MKRFIVILVLVVNLTLACSLMPQAIDAVEEVIPIVENVIQELVTEEAVPSVVVPTDTSNQVESEPIPGNLSEGLVAHFSFNGEVFEDQSGLLSEGTYLTSTEDRFNTPGGALAFNGVDSFIEVQDSDLLDLAGDFTIAFFIKGNPESDHEWLIITKHQAGICQPEETSWMIRYQKDMGLRFVNYDTSADCGKVILANPYVDLLDGQWYFVAFVNSTADGLMHLYINGIHIMSVSNAELNIGNNDIPLIIGNQYQGIPEHALDAVLDDLYIYGRALDYEQILTLSQIGK